METLPEPSPQVYVLPSFAIAMPHSKPPLAVRISAVKPGWAGSAAVTSPDVEAIVTSPNAAAWNRMFPLVEDRAAFSAPATTCPYRPYRKPTPVDE